MAKLQDGLLWGVLLVLAGVAFLLWNFGVFAQYEEIALLIVTGLFALGGLVFLAGYLANRQEWWRVIPGFALLAVAGIIFLSSRSVAAEWIGALLYIGIALAFAVIYLANRQANWWALIPFGAMLVMVVIVLLASQGVAEKALGAILFSGMGLVFLLVYLLSPERGRFRWALIPAVVLLVMGLLALAGALVDARPAWAPALRLWPLVLVAVGVAAMTLSLRGARPAPEVVTELPPQPQPEELPATPGTSVTEFDEHGEMVASAAAQLPAPEPATEVDDSSGEVPDLYEFLRAAPPDST